jgi:hypothetical protein
LNKLSEIINSDVDNKFTCVLEALVMDLLLTYENKITIFGFEVANSNGNKIKRIKRRNKI